MPKVVTEARSMCPELIDAVKTIDELAYTRSYSEVFEDLVEWMVWQHLFPPGEKNPLDKYSEKEQQSFLAIFKIIQDEVRNRVGLWTMDHGSKHVDDLRSNGGWYDPLGRMYECVTSKNKSSRMGQYFTPEHVVDVMVRINPPANSNEVQKIFDPACGSGRMGLAAATHVLNNKTPSWVTMNDLDPICAKMTAANMCLNGIVGEVTCMNGLEIEGSSYRFGYKVEPAIAQFPQEMMEHYRLLILMKSGQDIKKQYVLKPIPYEATYLKRVNDQLLKEYEERKHIADKEEQERAIKELQDQVKARMAGTLFEDDVSQIENVALPLERKREKQSNPQNPTSADNQQSLF